MKGVTREVCFRVVCRLAALIFVGATSHPPQAVASAVRYLDLPQTYVTAQKCSFNLIGDEDIPTDISPRLTSGWSQEGVGVPEVRSFLSENGIILRKVRVGVVDSGIDIPLIHEHLSHPGSGEAFPHISANPGYSHGAKVTMVIAGPQFGMTQNAMFTYLYDFRSSPKVHLLESEVRPVEIMTRSLNVNRSTSREMSDLLKENQGQKFLLVNSAGNDYLKDYRTTGALPGIFGDVPTLLVSSVTPTGRTNSDSGGGPQIVVGAPSYGPGFQHPKDYLQNLDGGWEFSGTSASAPMVTGALVAVFGLMEGLSFDEVNELLKQTSFSTRDFQGGHNYGGYGVLNYYKLMRVAYRLQQSGWPENRGTIFESGPGSIYDFEEEAIERFNFAADFLSDNPQGSCEDKLTVLKELRQGFFLNPNHVGIRQAIYALYVNEGYHDQALYFSPLGAEFYGPFLSFHQLERELVNSVASGQYDVALSAVRRGGPAFATALSQQDVLRTVFEMALARPNEERADFMLAISRIFPGVQRVRIIATLVLEYIHAENKEELEFIKVLLLEEGNLDATDPEGRSALYWAVRACNFEFVDFLLQHGAEVGPLALIAASEFPEPEKHSVVYVRRMGILRALLQKGDVNAQNASGTTALYAAVYRRNYETVLLLLQHGAEVNAAALKEAAIHKDSIFLRLLLLEGKDVNVNAKDSTGGSALSYAVLQGNIEAVELLLEYGAEVDLLALYTAERQWWPEITELLRKHL